MVCGYILYFLFGILTLFAGSFEECPRFLHRKLIVQLAIRVAQPLSRPPGVDIARTSSLTGKRVRKQHSFRST